MRSTPKCGGYCDDDEGNLRAVCLVRAMADDEDDEIEVEDDKCGNW